MRLSDTKNNSPIPYRDSKLTRLLQPALEGDSKINIICNISPSSKSYEETLSTLKFAQRAKKIKQSISKNIVKDSKALIIQYQKEIHVLQEKLREMENRMNQEVNKDISEEMSTQLILLQEEKEKADARLENILQEKLQLQKELETLKSFIIHPEDVKSSKIIGLESDDENLLNCRLSIENIQRIKEEVVRPISINFSDFLQSRCPSEIPKSGLKESLLTDNIESINDILNSEEPLTKFSVQGSTGTIDIHADCFKIMEEQDRIIATLQKALTDKEEEIGCLKDALTLCRNNLATIQRNNKKNNK
jgi:Kinesin motor domain